MHELYVTRSAAEYYEDLEHSARQTKRWMTRLGDRQLRYQKMFPRLHREEMNKLKVMEYYAGKANVQLAARETKLRIAISQLSRIEKKTILGTVFSILTAPIRHAFNLVDSIMVGDDTQFFKSATMLGLTFLGVGAVADVAEAFEGVGALVSPTDFTLEDPGVHLVAPHEVSGYTTAEGTVVESYERGGETGYLRSDPDGFEGNNLG
ncbi:hypothetical protein [Bacillus fonticola]|uniref:hypothetical protein n=1 Tax=Bacillus fonticola TaxID=2728853 RepID=UPI001473F110|nr:hypothetical protein [Bacillus fonticola]